MANKEVELDPSETPVIFGLWQLVPSGEPENPPTENYFVKKLAELFEKISSPITQLLYSSTKIPLEYSRLNHIGIVLLTSIIPLSLFLANYYYISKKIPKIPTRPSSTSKTTATQRKTWNTYYAKLRAHYSGIQNRTMSYMICMWMSMFVLIIFLYPRLKNTTE